MEEIIDAFAVLLGYATPIVCIFGFTKYALRTLHDVFNGGRLQ